MKKEAPVRTELIFETEERDGQLVLTGYHGHKKTVVLPEDVTVVGMHAFRCCFSMEELILPSSVRVIEAEAFNGCYGLKSIHFSEGLREIAHRGFWCCSALTALQFPRSLRRIGSRAFECCSALREVYFSGDGVQIDEYAFHETPYFEKKLRDAARIMEQSRKKAKGGLNYYNDHGDAAVKLDNFAELVLPEGVTHIDHWAYSNSVIKKLVLPNSLRTLGMCAFKDCRELETVSLSPNTYCNYKLRLGPSDGIFAGCTKLTEIILRGPLREFTWHDAEKPEILHGFDRERTFLHCPSLSRLTAHELPLALIPEEWMQFALNGFLADPDRDLHYLPEIAEEYHDSLRAFRKQLIARGKRELSLPLVQYLTERELIREEETEPLLARAAEQKDPEITALLMDYRARHCRNRSFAGALFDAIGDL